MIPNIAHATNAHAAYARPQEARANLRRPVTPEPAAEPSAAKVDLEPPLASVGPGFGLDLAYSRETVLAMRGGLARRVEATRVEHDLSVEFRFAVAALPRDDQGEVDLEALANIDEKQAVLGALDRIAAEGLREPGALATFIKAVDGLFAEYERDLGMDSKALAEARQRFIDDVTGFFDRIEAEEKQVVAVLTPSGLPIVLESPDAGLRERVTARRHDLLTAAGDISKVLTELTADVLDRPSDADARKRLGSYLKDLSAAAEARSTRELRDGARARLGAPAGEPPVPTPGSTPADADPLRVAQAFLTALA